jgi:hypothetical protein
MVAWTQGIAWTRRRQDGGPVHMPPMPPMSPMPPPPIGSSFFGSSATMASVVIIRPAIDAAFCSAVRTTLVGSRMPILIMSPYSPVCAL